MKLLYCNSCKYMMSLEVNVTRFCPCSKSSGTLIPVTKVAQINGPCYVLTTNYFKFQDAIVSASRTYHGPGIPVTFNIVPVKNRSIIREETSDSKV